MRGKFNYLIFFLRLIFAAVFLACSLAALIMGPRQWFADHDLSGAVDLTFTLLLLLSFVNFKISRAVWTERFTMRVAADSVIITDLILFKRRVLRSEDIKGFSLSEYPLRGINFKSILLYLDNGQKVELNSLEKSLISGNG